MTYNYTDYIRNNVIRSVVDDLVANPQETIQLVEDDQGRNWSVIDGRSFGIEDSGKTSLIERIRNAVVLFFKYWSPSFRTNFNNSLQVINLAFQNRIIKIIEDSDELDKEVNTEFSDIPKDVIRQHILPQIDNHDVISFGLTSKRYQDIANQELLHRVNNNTPLIDLNFMKLDEILAFVKKNGEGIHTLNFRGLEYTDHKFNGYWLNEILKFCPKINHLEVTLGILFDDDLKNLKKLPLKILNLRECNQITDRGLIHLKGMKLNSLDLSGCVRITDNGLANLAGMPLNHLNLSTNLSWDEGHFTDNGLEVLEGMPLHTLNLKGRKMITDRGLSILIGMPLVNLNLGECELITNEGINHIQKMSLQNLNLENCKLINDDSLVYLRDMPLKDLNLSGSAITDRGLENLENMPLNSLRLYGCRMVTDAGLTHLKKLPLKTLNLGECGLITNNGLIFLKNLSLTSLNLRGSQIGDNGLKLLSNLPLKDLNLQWCRNITGNSLTNLRGLPLNELNLKGCNVHLEDLNCLLQLPLTTIEIDLKYDDEKKLGQRFPNTTINCL